MAINCSTHLFGSVTGYTTLAKSSDITQEEDSALSGLGFGQTNDSNFIEGLFATPTAYGRRLPSGRYAITRCFPGTSDVAGRITLLLASVIMDLDTWLNHIRGGLGNFLNDESVWDLEKFSTGKQIKVGSLGGQLPTQVSDYYLADYLASIHNSSQNIVVVLPERSNTTDVICHLAGALAPEDAAEFRWGIRLLSTTSPVDLMTMVGAPSTGGRRKVVKCDVQHEFRNKGAEYYAQKCPSIPALPPVVALASSTIVDERPTSKTIQFNYKPNKIILAIITIVFLLVAFFAISNPDPTGACCVGEDCSILSDANCTSASGAYQGDDTTCGDDPCALPDPVGGEAGGSQAGGVLSQPGTSPPDQGQVKKTVVGKAGTATVGNNSSGGTGGGKSQEGKGVGKTPAPGGETGGSQSGGEQTPGGEAGGSQSGGEQTPGGEAGGSQSGGEQTPGGEAGGSQSGGEETPDGEAGGSQSGGEKTPGGETGGSKSEDANNTDDTSGEPNSASDGATSSKHIQDHQSSDDFFIQIRELWRDYVIKNVFGKNHEKNLELNKFKEVADKYIDFQINNKKGDHVGFSVVKARNNIFFDKVIDKDILKKLGQLLKELDGIETQIITFRSRRDGGDRLADVRLIIFILEDLQRVSKNYGILKEYVKYLEHLKIKSKEIPNSTRPKVEKFRSGSIMEEWRENLRKKGIKLAGDTETVNGIKTTIPEIIASPNLDKRLNEIINQLIETQTGWENE